MNNIVKKYTDNNGINYEIEFMEINPQETRVPNDLKAGVNIRTIDGRQYRQTVPVAFKDRAGSLYTPYDMFNVPGYRVFLWSDLYVDNNQSYYIISRYNTIREPDTDPINEPMQEYINENNGNKEYFGLRIDTIESYDIFVNYTRFVKSSYYTKSTKKWRKTFINGYDGNGGIRRQQLWVYNCHNNRPCLPPIFRSGFCPWLNEGRTEFTLRFGMNAITKPKIIKREPGKKYYERVFDILTKCITLTELGYFDKMLYQQHVSYDFLDNDKFLDHWGLARIRHPGNG